MQGRSIPGIPCTYRVLQVAFVEIDRKSPASTFGGHIDAYPDIVASVFPTEYQHQQRAGFGGGRRSVRWAVCRRLAGPRPGGFGTLKYSIFNADGSVAKSEAIANQDTTGNIQAGDVAIAALTGGGFAITWSPRLNIQ